MVPARRSQGRTRRFRHRLLLPIIRILPALLALSLVACGGGKREITLTVRDEENIVVPGIEIRQVGSDVILETTDDKGLALIRVAPHRGEALRLRLTSPQGESGPLYSFSDPEGVVQVSEQDLNSGYLRVRVRRATATTDGEDGAEAKSTLVLVSDPAGAQVQIGGIDRGRTPLSVPDLPSGRTMVEIRLAGYHPWARELVLFPGENSDTAVLQRAEITTGTLSVDSEPVGASIELDGKAAGATPAVFNDLPAGRHRVKLSKSGYGEFATSIQLSPGGESPVQAVLRRLDEPKPPPPPPVDDRADDREVEGVKRTYSVSLRRGYAEVFVDDETVNRNITGNFSITLAPGRHRFRVRNEARGIDVVLTYEVRSSDDAKALILDVEGKAVVPKRGR